MRRAVVSLLLILAAVGGCGDGGARDEANQLYSEGGAAASSGDHQKAVERFSQALEKFPAGFIHFERAKSYAALGKDDEARKDIEAARADGVAESECSLLLTEMQKPLARRFKLPPRPTPSVK